MARFYDHPDGTVHFSAPAGGTGGGVTSEYDGPAKSADMAAYPKEHKRFLDAKRAAAEQASHASGEAAKAARDLELHRELSDETRALAHTMDEFQPEND